LTPAELWAWVVNRRAQDNALDEFFTAEKQHEQKALRDDMAAAMALESQRMHQKIVDAGAEAALANEKAQKLEVSGHALMSRNTLLTDEIGTLKGLLSRQEQGAAAEAATTNARLAALQEEIQTLRSSLAEATALQAALVTAPVVGAPVEATPPAAAPEAAAGLDLHPSPAMLDTGLGGPAPEQPQQTGPEFSKEEPG
jgi:hypothetical protein